MALVGNTWLQDEEPTTGVQARQEWIKDNGERYFRNTSNTAWVYQGNINTPMGDCLSIAGGTMTGPILGAHGLPPLADPDFVDAAFVEGERLSTRAELTKLQRFLMARMNMMVREIFLSLKSLETTDAQTNPTTVKSVSFWGNLEGTLDWNNSSGTMPTIKLKDVANLASDFFDAEETAIVIKQAGYYYIDPIPLYIPFKNKEYLSPWVQGVVGPADWCVWYVNDAVYTPPDVSKFSKALGRFYKYDPEDMFTHDAVTLPDKGTFGTIVVGDLPNLGFYFNAGDRITFRLAGWSVAPPLDGDGDPIGGSTVMFGSTGVKAFINDFVQYKLADGTYAKVGFDHFVYAPMAYRIRFNSYA